MISETMENTENTQPSDKKEDIAWLRRLLADLRQEQSNPRLRDVQKAQCKQGIRAVQSALDALEIQVYAG